MWTDDSSANTEVFSAWAPTGRFRARRRDRAAAGRGNASTRAPPVTLRRERDAARPERPDDGRPGTSATARTGAGSPVDHAWAAPGSYVVTLKVRDALGLVSTATLDRHRARARVHGRPGAAPARRPRHVRRGRDPLHDRAHARLEGARVPVTVLLQYTASAGAGSGYARVTLARGRAARHPGRDRLPARERSRDPERRQPRRSARFAPCSRAPRPRATSSSAGAPRRRGRAARSASSTRARRRRRRRRRSSASSRTRRSAATSLSSTRGRIPSRCESRSRARTARPCRARPTRRCPASAGRSSTSRSSGRRASGQGGRSRASRALHPSRPTGSSTTP